MTDERADRAEAIDELRDDRARTDMLLDAIDPTAYETTGLGGGDWSPKDLIGHLETWDQHALDAIAAWQAGERPAIGVALETLGTDEVNRREVERKAALPLEEVRTSAAGTHRALLDALASVSDDWWRSHEQGEERSHGQMLGGVLGGSRGYFRHDPDHWPDLEGFAEQHPAP
jgi:DinB superfamily